MNTIYTFWWQGFDNAPDIIKLCHQSLLKHTDREKHKVVILNEKNLFRFVNLPGYIIDKYRAGKITTTHLSDIIRSVLLENTGGLWVDASILFTKDLDDRELFERDFFTLKRKESCSFDITNKWTCSLMGGKKDFPLFGFLKEMWYAYWKKEEELITYLLTDHLIYLAYQKNDRVKKALDLCPEFYYRTDYFQNMLNHTFDSQTYQAVMEKESYCKLTYKMDLSERDKNGKVTFYGKLKEEYMGDEKISVLL